MGTPEIEIFGDAAGQEVNEILQSMCWTNLNTLAFNYGGVARTYSGKSGWVYLQDRKGKKVFPQRERCGC